MTKIWTWIKAIAEGWKIIFGVITAATIIGATAIKIDKGVKVMSDTASTVKEIKNGYDSIRIDVTEIKKELSTQKSIQTFQGKSYVDHLKLENRLDEVIKYYEDKAAAERSINEKKNLSSIQ